MGEQKIYILLNNSYELDDYYSSDGEIMFISLDYNKVKAELDKYREEVETWDPKNHFNLEIEIQQLTDTCVKYYCGKWLYEYDLVEYPLDQKLTIY